MSNFADYQSIITEYKSGLAVVISDYTGLQPDKLQQLSLSEINSKALKLLSDTRYSVAVIEDTRLYVGYADRSLISLYYAAIKEEDNETASLCNKARQELEALKKGVGM